jgi:hypothetical protein
MSDSMGTQPQAPPAGYWLGPDGGWNPLSGGVAPPGYWRASDGNWYPPQAPPAPRLGGPGAGEVFGATDGNYYPYPPQHNAQPSASNGRRLVRIVMLVLLILVVCIAAITLLGNNASTRFSQVGP